MKQETGDLWSNYPYVDAICITTNGYTKKDGSAVMGRGCAAQASKRFPGINQILGELNSTIGNVPHILIKSGKTSGLATNTSIVSFPVKDVTKRYTGSNVVTHMTSKFKYYDMVPGWALKAEMSIIEASAKHLAEMADAHQWNNVVLPRPGCGAGELSWRDVEPVLKKHLNDRFTCWTY